jgi:hypothetical protein
LALQEVHKPPEAMITAAGVVLEDSAECAAISLISSDHDVITCSTHLPGCVTFHWPCFSGW